MGEEEHHTLILVCFTDKQPPVFFWNCSLRSPMPCSCFLALFVPGLAAKVAIGVNKCSNPGVPALWRQQDSTTTLPPWCSMQAALSLLMLMFASTAEALHINSISCGELWKKTKYLCFSLPQRMEYSWDELTLLSFLTKAAWRAGESSWKASRIGHNHSYFWSFTYKCSSRAQICNKKTIASLLHLRVRLLFDKTCLKATAARSKAAPMKCVSSGVLPSPIILRGHLTASCVFTCLTPGLTMIVSPGLYSNNSSSASSLCIILDTCILLYGTHKGIDNVPMPKCLRFMQIDKTIWWLQAAVIRY